MNQKQLILEKDGNGKIKPVDAHTGGRYQVELSSPILTLERAYHDDMPVVGAPFELELENGQVVRGNLDKNGQARILNLPSPPKRVRFKPDIRAFTEPPAPDNPEYKDDFDTSAAAALAQKHASGQARPDVQRKSMAGEALEWVWGTVQGNFNDQQTTSQIIVDAVISAIPLVGEATDVRDLIAILLGMVRDPKKREDKWEWMGLVVVLLSLIPLFGGAIKGVGKLLLRALKSGGKVGNSIASFIGALNRIGWGNAVEWLKKLDLEKYAPEALGYFRKITQHLDEALTAIQKVPGWMLPGTVLETARRIQTGLKDLMARGEKMIPDSIKDMNRKLKEIQQQIYEGEWVPVGKVNGAKPKVKTREVEIKFERKKKSGKVQLVIKNPHFPPSDPDIHYRNQAGWPDLKAPEFNSKEKGFHWAICSFSGEIIGRRLEPGKKIFRIGGAKTKMDGMFWLDELPKNGREWREEFAVLERWSENGKFVEFVVPEPGLWVWEGKIASQLDTNKWLSNGKLNPGYGQYLKGGKKQFLIDFDFEGISGYSTLPGNKASRIILEKQNWQATGWSQSDLLSVNFSESANHVERKMGELELEEKGLHEPFSPVGENGSRVVTSKNLIESQNNREDGD
ncbi:MAG: hypothetical protein ABIW76_21135 [Fibrobacteria bacterium]